MSGGGLCNRAHSSHIGSRSRGGRARPTFITRGPVFPAPVQAALVHVRRLPLCKGEGPREVGRMLAGARGHFKHANAALSRVHILPQNAQNWFLVPLGGRGQKHHDATASPPRAVVRPLRGPPGVVVRPSGSPSPAKPSPTDYSSPEDGCSSLKGPHHLEAPRERLPLRCIRRRVWVAGV